MQSNKFWAAAGKVLAAVTVMLLAILILTPAAGAQTYTVLYTFVGGTDGAFPELWGGGLIFDAAGNLYGANTRRGHSGNGQGVVFQLMPGAGGSWTENSLHIFCLDDWNVCSDGAYPTASLIFDAAGNLYGMSLLGGIGPCYNDGIDGCGVIFKLTANPDGSWTYNPLYQFTGGKDGAYPNGSLTLDAAGNLYGTTSGGGGKGCANAYGCGVAFELAPNPDGTWTQHVLHRYTGGWDGALPYSNHLVLDTTGSLYGTTYQGGTAGYGVVFKLTPRAGGGWKEVVLHQFMGQPGKNPTAGLTIDQSGNLYGTTTAGGAQDAGSIFELTPAAGGKWTYRVLHVFNGRNGRTPYAGVSLDSSGDLYGTTVFGGKGSCNGGQGCGVVFKLTPQPDGKWKETILYKFTGGADGFLPVAGASLDASGNVYGAADNGGDLSCNFGNGCGVVFEITP